MTDKLVYMIGLACSFGWGALCAVLVPVPYDLPAVLIGAALIAWASMRD